ncbi:hypothetical protein AAUPMB_15325 [Pasteurella multocida subsp. multocida str. Anand1_buffalo]|nr:hypothetical protein AAUPMB_15325 [Pasteurella multocida subsp. multocida str. Anand1_buffalo]
MLYLINVILTEGFTMWLRLNNVKTRRKLTALCCGLLCMSVNVFANDLSKIQQQIKQQEQKLLSKRKRRQNYNHI